MGEITPADAGCWLDGRFGWHNTYRVIDIAMEHGFVIDELDSEALDAFRAGEAGGTLTADEVHDIVYYLADEATNYLQTLAPEGFHFEWDMGEFGLYQDDDELA